MINFFTNKKSPTSKEFFIEPLGMVKAWIQKNKSKRTMIIVPSHEFEKELSFLKKFIF